MLTIGDFARHGQVSVRMLRHYDATGLLRPQSAGTARELYLECPDDQARWVTELQEPITPR
jgi:DNA-binding transcriptional MerR regulator